MVQDRAIVLMVDQSYMVYQTMLFAVTLSDLQSTFQGHDNIQSQITLLIVSHVWSIQWFHFQWPWVTLYLDFKVLGLL